MIISAIKKKIIKDIKSGQLSYKNDQGWKRMRPWIRQSEKPARGGDIWPKIWRTRSQPLGERQQIHHLQKQTAYVAHETVLGTTENTRNVQNTACSLKKFKTHLGGLINSWNKCLETLQHYAESQRSPENWGGNVAHFAACKSHWLQGQGSLPGITTLILPEKRTQTTALWFLK